MSIREYLEKAVLTSPYSESTGTRGAGALPPETAEQFIRVAIDYTVILKEATNQISRNPVFEIPRLDFSGRVLHAGVEGQRLADAQRFAPTRGLVTLTTHLFRAELDVTPEFLEDNIEREGAAQTLMQMLAEAVGRDAEEFAIKSDTARTASEDTDLRQFDGIIKQLQAGLPAGQKVDASTFTTYDQLFSAMISALPARYKRNLSNLRIYVPFRHLEGYRRSLAARGTPLGDKYQTAEYSNRLPFWGIDVVGVPLLTGTSTINGATVNYDSFAILIDPKNIYVGWHRNVSVEKVSMPWEGIIGFFASLRYDVKIAEPGLGVLAYNIPATLS